MKKSLITTALCVITGCFNALNAQVNTSTKPKLVLIEIDRAHYPHASGKQSHYSSITEITRLEIDKLSMYNVMNRYDLDYLIKRDSLELNNCFS
mgnify:FL=1